MVAPDAQPPKRLPLRRTFEEREVRVLWQALTERRDSAGNQNRTRPRFYVACVIVLCCALCGVWEHYAHDAPLALRDDRALPLALGSTRAPLLYPLDDGSRIALERGARLDVVRNDGSEIVTVLRRGRTTFDVKPGGKRHWSVEAGLLSVHVLGTSFVVEREAGRVSVRVLRGVVLVRSPQLPDGVQRVAAGQSLVVGREPRGKRHQDAKATSSQVESTPPPTLEPAAPRPANVSWWSLAASGQLIQARDRIAALGGIERVARATRDPELLLRLFDVARSEGESRELSAPLTRILELAPDSSEAAIAAFMLGKLELDARAEPTAAARHFTFVLNHPGGQALHEEALARLVLSLRAVGESGGARARAEEYLARFPHGRHGKLMRAELERPP